MTINNKNRSSFNNSRSWRAAGAPARKALIRSETSPGTFPGYTGQQRTQKLA